VGIETHELTLHTLDGVHLEADLARPAQPRAAVVLCHPHPLYGGRRTNAVVDAIFQHLVGLDVAALRFDFRGAGGSDGSHGGGTDERIDVATAVDALAAVTDAALWIVGYSFGASVALDVAHPRAEGWVGIAPPLAAMPGPRVAGVDHRPKHLLVPQHDQYSPPERTAEAVAGWPATTIEIIDGADHFLTGHLQHVAERVADLIGMTD
jgi:alpha/beta superfamily hydrolase